eukprot:COSAG01_NODE_852_length_13108_cov_7.167423_7_plen_100_part_00
MDVALRRPQRMLLRARHAGLAGGSCAAAAWLRMPHAADRSDSAEPTEPDPWLAAPSPSQLPPGRCPPAPPPLGALHRQVGDPAAPHYGEPVPPHRRLRS